MKYIVALIVFLLGIAPCVISWCLRMPDWWYSASCRGD